MLLKTRLNLISVASVLVTLTLAVLVSSQFNSLIQTFQTYKVSASVAERDLIIIEKEINQASVVIRDLLLGDSFSTKIQQLEVSKQLIKKQFSLLFQVISAQQSKEEASLMTNITAAQTASAHYLQSSAQHLQKLQTLYNAPQTRLKSWQTYRKVILPLLQEAKVEIETVKTNLDFLVLQDNNKIEQALNNARLMNYVIAAMVAFIIIIGILNAALIQHGMLRLHRLRKMMYKIGSTSDLESRIQIKGEDEIAQTSRIFNDMLDQFQMLIQKAASTTIEVKNSSHQLANVSGRANQNLHTQNTEISNAVTAVSQMRSNVIDVSKDAQQAAISASEAQLISANAINLSNNAVQSMQYLSQQTVQTTEAVRQLNVSCNEISTVLSVIETVSEQTNLLALNAAIEAARAGDQGRGFAVVAGEVRSLATRSQESTAQIQSIIEHLIHRSNEAVNAMEDNQSLAAKSVITTNDIRQSIEEVVVEIDRIQIMNASIAQNVTEQSTAAVEIDDTMQQLRSLSERSEHNAVEINSSSGTLKGLSEQLQLLVTQFKY